VLIHYFGVDALTSLFYIGTEPCSPDMGRVGYHCFGDFNLGSVTSLQNPWDVVTQLGPWNYPAASMAPSLFFIELGKLIGRPSVTMLLYILIMIIGLTIPAIWATRGRPIWIRVVISTVFGFLSVPALMAIDRGNVVGLAVPFMFLAVVAIARDKPLAAAIGIAAASCAKPQFGLAILIFALFGRWVWVAICAGIALVLHLSAFLLWPAALPGSIPQALAGMFSFGGQSTLGNTIPTSVSFAKGAYLLEQWFIVPFRGGGSWVEAHQALVTGVIVVALLAILFFARRALPKATTMALLFLISALAVPTSFTYYFVAAIPLAAIVLRDPLSRGAGGAEPTVFRGVLELDETRRWSQYAAASFFAITLAATISRVFLPIPIPTMNFFYFTTADFVTILWMIAIPLYGIARIRAHRHKTIAERAMAATSN
jgi:hypothetical protein